MNYMLFLLSAYLIFSGFYVAHIRKLPEKFYMSYFLVWMIGQSILATFYLMLNGYSWYVDALVPVSLVALISFIPELNELNHEMRIWFDDNDI